MKGMMRRLLLTAYNLEIAMFGVRVRDARCIGSTLAVGDKDLITYGVPQHPHAVRALFFRERLAGFYVGTVKEVHLANLRLDD